MKKFEHLGKKLSREEQKRISGGTNQWANTTCTCGGGTQYPVCDTTCTGAYAQCDTVCGAGNVVDYGTCEILGACR